MNAVQVNAWFNYGGGLELWGERFIQNLILYLSPAVTQEDKWADGSTKKLIPLKILKV